LQQPIYLYREDETVRLEGSAEFGCTDSFFADCMKLKISAKQLLTRFAHQKVFLMLKPHADKPFYSILTEAAILSCVITGTKSFLITRAFAKNPNTQNQFIRHSVKLYATGGAYVSYNQSGKRHTWGEAPAVGSSSSSEKAVDRLVRLINERQRTDEGDEEPSTISGELESLLEIAEQYVIAEDEIEKHNVQAGNLISYARFETESDYSRVDKLALSFLVNNLSRNVYKKGMRLAVALSDETPATGAITVIAEEEEPTKITILFDAVFDNSLLPTQGILSPVYNDIQRQVRESVIENIRSFGSSAAYFDEVIGKGQPSRMGNADTRSLEEALRSSERPPNDSQIEAIAKGIRTEDALLVLGPPGTGKTTVILEWVKHFVRKEGKRVLISSQNNKAVDNVLERLSMEPGIETIRVGSEDKVQANIQHLMFENKAYDLQQRITGKSGEYLEKLLIDDEVLKPYTEMVKAAGTALNSFHILDAKLKSMYALIRQDKLLPLQQLFEAYGNLSNELSRLKAHAIQLAGQIAASENSGTLMKWLTAPLRYFRKKQLTKLHAQHSLHRDRQAQAIANYNSIYQALSRDLASEELNIAKEDWQRSFKSLSEQLQKLVESTPDIQSMVGALELPFTNIESCTKKDIDGLLSQCEERLIKITASKRALQRWLGHLESKRNYVLAQVLLDSVDLVGATCIGINSQQRFNELDFDVTIIDEAGQIQIHNAIVPMSRSPKVIMLGDHLQIPPVLNQQVMDRCMEDGTDTELLSTSFFEYLYARMHKSDKILLDTQYRMPAEIADLLSDWFYKGEYKSFEGKRGLPTIIPTLLNSPFAVIDTSEAPNRHESKAEGGGYYNRYESELVVRLLRTIISSVNPETTDPNSKLYVPGGRPFQPTEIGIITPYNGQVKQIRESLANHCPELSKSDIQQMVASLDSFQGQERSVIIYSCTRSSSLPPHLQRIGFLNELRRLNVAMSRCQQQLIFIGDIRFLQSCEFEETDDYGFPLQDEVGNPMPGTSEKQFSAFIQLMMRHIESGNGQRLSSPTLEQSMAHLERGVI